VKTNWLPELKNKEKNRPETTRKLSMKVLFGRIFGVDQIVEVSGALGVYHGSKIVQTR
jgi:hypothetical protein